MWGNARRRFIITTAACNAVLADLVVDHQTYRRDQSQVIEYSVLPYCESITQLIYWREAKFQHFLLLAGQLYNHRVSFRDSKKPIF